MERGNLATVLGVAGLPDYLNAVDKIMLDGAAAGGKLGEAMEEIITTGGKRLRPALVVTAAVINDGEVTDTVISTAAAVEMVHLASLVHDDMIDKSKLRRDRPSVPAAYGEAIALLLGDYLIAKACGLAAKTAPSAAVILAETITAMTDGQANGSSADKVRPFSRPYYETVSRKTGGLLSAACRLGGMTAGLKNGELEALAKYGEVFGAAFQIIDDIIDKDIPSGLAARAVNEIKRQNRLALKALAGFGDSPAAEGLKRLPDHYLNWALP